MAQWGVVMYDAFQGIQSDDIVVKNAAVVNGTLQTAQQFDFAPPYNFSMLPFASAKQNAFLTREVHGLKWESGYISYHKLGPLLSEKTRALAHLFTRGASSAAFLTKLLKRPVLDIETFLTKYEARMTLFTDDHILNIAGLVGLIVRRCCSDHSGLKEKFSSGLECCYTAALRLSKYLERTLEVINRRNGRFKVLAEQLVKTDIDPLAVGHIQETHGIGLGWSAVEIIALLLSRDHQNVKNIMREEEKKAHTRRAVKSTGKSLECTCQCNQCIETRYYRAAGIELPHINKISCACWKPVEIAAEAEEGVSKALQKRVKAQVQQRQQQWLQQQQQQWQLQQQQHRQWQQQRIAHDCKNNNCFPTFKGAASREIESDCASAPPKVAYAFIDGGSSARDTANADIQD